MCESEGEEQHISLQKKSTIIASGKEGPDKQIQIVFAQGAPGRGPAAASPIDLLNRRIFLASPGLFLQELKLVYIILVVVGILKKKKGNILSISRIIMDTVLFTIKL